jgi:hemoglobin/transferrin/lactoferrin receptor protein
MTVKSRTVLLGGAALALAGWGSAAAQETTSYQVAEAQADAITVTATRQERRTDEVPATVTVITDEDIENDLATDIRDLVRFEPGVTVRSAPSRFTAAGATTGRDGNAGFNIRGLEGNRVLIIVDGVRVPDAFSFGGQSVGRGDYVDLDLLKSVEILRGPASALYGSDGIVGVVSFTTRDPDDFLSGDAFAGRARIAYASADESWTGGLVGAAGAGDWSALLAYTYRDAHETDTQGTNDAPDIRRTKPNPQDFETNSWLGKLVFQPSSAHRFRLTGEYYDREIVSEVLSARAILATTASTATLDLDAIDTIERSRIGLDYRYRGEGIIDRALASVYYQQSENREFADEDRNTAADRLRINTFDNAVWGVSTQFDGDASFLGLTHNFVYGLDYSLTRQEGMRDGTVPPVGETFPTRAFPNTDSTLAGVYVQDDIRLLDGALSIIPALRYDYYEIDPEPDAGFTWPSAGQEDGRFTPRLGVVSWPTEHWGAFANYAQGYKTPSPSQVNNGFANVVANYRTIPNPDLEPETSESFEGGLRVRDLAFIDGHWSGQVAAFVGKFENFIDQVQVGGDFTPSNPATFQFVNLGEAEINGVEFRIDGEWESGFGISLASSWTEGEQTTSGAAAPLNSIDPWKMVLGLSYVDPAGRFGGRMIVTHSGEKQEEDVDQICGGAGCFIPDDFTIVDLTAYWNITDQAALRVGVFNLTDETYWWWSDVRGVANNFVTVGGVTYPALPAFSQPDRNVSASLTYRF